MNNTSFALVSAMLTFFAAALGWHFKGKKINADARGSELDNVEKAIAIWRKLAEEQTGQNEELIKKVDNLTREVFFLRSEQQTLLKENQNLREQIKSFEEMFKKNM